MRAANLSSAVLLASALGLAACGGGGSGTGVDSGGLSTGQGTLRVSLTDAPSCGYEEVNVTVLSVRVHQSASAGDNDGGWQELSLPAPLRIDLLTLTNGVREELGQLALPAGKYTQMRLVLAANGGSAPYANSVVPVGGAETPLDTPSGQQSGLKMNIDVDVPADKVADFVIDFDACKSVVKRGASGKYNLKPVLTGTTVLSDAGLRVIGYVDTAVVAPGAVVSLQFEGVPVKATAPDPTTGQFVLYPVPVGTYDLVVAADGRVTAVMTGVPVVTTEYTYVGSPALRIAPPPATMRAVAGSVTSALPASVRALQKLTGGPTIEVGWTVADADTGAFGLSLPIEAPIRTSYVTPLPVAYAFVADPGAAGKYLLDAESGGAHQEQAIDASAPVPPVAFVFP